MECAKEEKVMSFDFREPQVPSFQPSLTEEFNKLSFVKLNASFKPFLLAWFSFLEAGIALWVFLFLFWFNLHFTTLWAFTSILHIGG